VITLEDERRILVEVIEIRGRDRKVRLGFTADPNIRIDRAEIDERRANDRRGGAA
jgi:sRNA-binding carbon storage regulator CsrA